MKYLVILFIVVGFFGTSFASESQEIKIFQPDVELLPDQKIIYGGSFTIHAWLQSYEDRPDDLGYYVDVLDPRHNQVDSTLWFAKEDFVYEFDTTHPAYNITQSGTYYVKLEKANFHERTGLFPKTITFEILFPEPESEQAIPIPGNCGPGTTLQDGICVVNSENTDTTTDGKWGDAFNGKHPPPLKQVKLGIPLHEIQCNGERTLIWQKDTLKPACVFHESELIFQRQWAKMRIGMPAEEITQEKLCLWYSDDLPKYLAPYCGLTSESTFDKDPFIDIMKNAVFDKESGHYDYLPINDNPNIMPDWFKNNAKWWAEGQIDDDSFVQGLQFLVKEGVMRIK